MSEQNRQEDANSAFTSITGHAPGELLETESNAHLLPATLEEATHIALDNHPRLKSADADIDAAQEQLHASRALFFPRVHLEIKGSENENIDGIDGTTRDTEVMLRARYNFTGGKDMARRQETVVELEQAREIRERTRRQVIESIQLSWNSWQTAGTQLEFFKVHMDASKQALESYRKQFNIGKRSLLDLLDQENEVFQANINYVKGLNDVDFANYRILAGTGKLLWALDVPLPDAASTIQ